MKDRVLASSLAGVLLVCGAADAAELRLMSDSAAGTFLDLASLGGEVVDVGYDGAATLPLAGFPGNYLFADSVIVGQNGAVAFGAPPGAGLCSGNDSIPSSCAFDGAQAAILFWDDIDDEDGDVTYVLLENNEVSTGARLIIEWSFHNFEDGESTLRFQLQVHPNTQPTGLYARYVYRIEGPAAGAGAGATIGYQDGNAGFEDIQFSLNQADAVTDGTALSLFIPSSGDLDQNGGVDVSDILILFTAWGPCSDCGTCPADLDGDCVVNVDDLGLLFDAWTQSP